MSLKVIIFIFNRDKNDSLECFLQKIDIFLREFPSKLQIQNYGYHIAFIKYRSTLDAFRQVRQINKQKHLFNFLKAYLFTPKYLKEMSFEFDECKKKVLDYIDNNLQVINFLQSPQQVQIMEDLHKQNNFKLIASQSMIIHGINSQIFTPVMIFNIVKQFGKINDIILQTVYPYKWYIQYNDVNNLILAIKSLDKMILFGAQVEIEQAQSKNDKLIFLAKINHLKFIKSQFDLVFANQPTKFLHLTTFKKNISVKDVKYLMEPFFRPKKIKKISQNELQTFVIILKNKQQAVELVSIYDHVKLGKYYLHFFFIEKISLK